MLIMKQPGVFRDGMLGAFREPHAFRDGVLGRLRTVKEPGVYEDGVLGSLRGVKLDDSYVALTGTNPEAFLTWVSSTKAKAGFVDLGEGKNPRYIGIVGELDIPEIVASVAGVKAISDKEFAVALLQAPVPNPGAKRKLIAGGVLVAVAALGLGYFIGKK